MESGYKKIGDPEINAWDAYRFERQSGPEHLDRCNGHTGPGGDYHYHSTATFPYIIGCYSGTPNLNQRRGGPPDRTQTRGRQPGRRGGGGRRGGPGGLDTAAPRLGLTVEDLAKVVDAAELRAYLRDPENVSFDFASPARELGVNEEELRQALEHQVETPVRYKGHRPGCTMTPEGYLLCHPNAVRGLVDQVQGTPK